MRGAYGIAVMALDEPGRIVAARLGSPMVVGLADEGNFIASDAMALAGVTDRIIFVEDGDVADVTTEKVAIYAHEGKDYRPVERRVMKVQAYTGAAELSPYRHYMQKEIFEQPRAFGDTLEGVEGITPTLFGQAAVIRLPENYGDLSPVLYVVTLQLFAYHVAVNRGEDVDKTRNLAKSVTME